MTATRIRPRILHKDAITFCKAHLGRDCFAPFTGADWSAWVAFVYLVECFSRGGGFTGDYDTNPCIRAMREVLKTCQNTEVVHQIFVQAIPAVMDWSHAGEIWPHVKANWDLRPIRT